MEFLSFLVGFRKFFITLLFISVMIIFRILNYINGAEFAENLQLAVVAYLGSNVGEHLLDLGKKWVEGKLSLKVEDDEKL